MIDTQFWILALIGTEACVLLALLVKRGMPPIPQADAQRGPGEPSAMNSARPSHSHHICTVRRQPDGSTLETELRNGMLDPANHAEVAKHLSSGPDCGIRWNDGHIEWGKAEPAE